MAHCKACNYTYYRARGLGSDRGPKAEKLERPSPQKYELFAIPTPYLVLARRVADIVNVGDPRLPVQVAKGAVCHGELVVGQGQSVNLFLQWFSP